MSFQKWQREVTEWCGYQAVKRSRSVRHDARLEKSDPRTSKSISMYLPKISNLTWLVVWNMNFIFPYVGDNHPNWRTHIFQIGRLNHQPVTIWTGQARFDYDVKRVMQLKDWSPSDLRKGGATIGPGFESPWNTDVAMGQNLWYHIWVDEHPFTAILMFIRDTGFWPITMYGIWGNLQVYQWWHLY